MSMLPALRPSCWLRGHRLPATRSLRLKLKAALDVLNVLNVLSHLQRQAHTEMHPASLHADRHTHLKRISEASCKPYVGAAAAHKNARGMRLHLHLQNQHHARGHTMIASDAGRQMASEWAT